MSSPLDTPERRDGGPGLEDVLGLGGSIANIASAFVRRPGQQRILRAIGSGLGGIQRQAQLRSSLTTGAALFEQLGTPAAKQVAMLLREDPQEALLLADAFGGSLGDLYQAELNLVRTAQQGGAPLTAEQRAKSIGIDLGDLTPEGRARFVRAHEAGITDSTLLLEAAGRERVTSDEIMGVVNFPDGARAVPITAEELRKRRTDDGFEVKPVPESKSPDTELNLKIFDRLDELASGFNAMEPIRDFREASRSARQFVEALKNPPSGVNDLTLLFRYIKAIDPGSVVRGEEVRLQQSTVSALTRLGIFLEQRVPGVGKTWREVLRDTFVSIERTDRPPRYADDVTVRILDPGQEFQMMADLSSIVKGSIPEVRNIQEQFRTRATQVPGRTQPVDLFIPDIVRTPVEGFSGDFETFLEETIKANGVPPTLPAAVQGIRERQAQEAQTIGQTPVDDALRRIEERLDRELGGGGGNAP